MGAGEGLCQGNDALALGDVDGDGDLDLVAEGRDNSGNPRLLLFLNEGGVLVEQTDILPAGLMNGAVALGDVDGDGDLDLAATGIDNTGARRFLVFRNDGHGNFTLAQEPWGPGDGFAYGSVAFGDVDSDGDLDLLVGGQSNNFGQGLNLFLNAGGTFTLGQQVMPQGNGVFNGHMVLGDIDQDGDLDLIVAGSTWDGSTSHQKLMQFTNTGGVFGPPRDLAELPGGGWQGLALGDANADGFPDLFAGGHDGSAFRLFYFCPVLFALDFSTIS